jgi:hypothetical protein
MPEIRQDSVINARYDSTPARMQEAAHATRSRSRFQIHV